jgi:hypothetical protein
VNVGYENLCASPEWAAWPQSEILPAVTAGVDLGDDVLEIGPGMPRMPYPDAAFDAVGSFTTPHHLPTAARAA